MSSRFNTQQQFKYERTLRYVAPPTQPLRQAQDNRELTKRSMSAQQSPFDLFVPHTQDVRIIYHCVNDYKRLAFVYPSIRRAFYSAPSTSSGQSGAN